MKRPQPGEYGEYYQAYIELTRGVDYLQNLQDSGDQLIAYMQSLDNSKWDYTYAKDKWTVKQVIQHLIDCDVVFLYRALTVVRGDTETSLPGFDQEVFAKNSLGDTTRPKEIIEMFRNLRSLTISMFKGFDNARLDKKGKANGNPVTPLSVAFIIAGHTYHHLNILKEKYQ